MEQHSQTRDTPASRHILEAQVRECYGRVVYTHKTQEKCVDILLRNLGHIKLWQIFLSAATTGGFIGVVFGGGKPAAVTGAVFSTALLALNTYTKSCDLGGIAQKHKQAAVQIWLIREKYLTLLTDIVMGEKPIEHLQDERDALLTELHAVYKGAPATFPKAYELAQKSLKECEDMTFSDEEIDKFLPKALRKSHDSSNTDDRTELTQR